MNEGSGSRARDIADEVMAIPEQSSRLRHLRRHQAHYDGDLIEEFRGRAQDVRRVDPRESARLAHLALVVAESIQDRPGRLRCLIERTKAAIQCGDSMLALESIEDASQLARVLADEVSQADIDLLRIQPLIALERYGQARAEAERVLSLFERRHERKGRILAHMALADLALRMDLPRRALAHYTKAEGLLPSSAGPQIRGVISLNRATALVACRRFRAAERHFARARALHRQSGCEHSVAQVDVNEAYGMMLRGRHHEALLRYAECESVLQRLDDVCGLAQIDLDRAELHLQIGMPDEAATFAASAETRFLTLGLAKERGRAAYVYARAAELRGDDTTALSWFERAQDLFQDLGLSERVFNCVLARAEILARRSDAAGARILTIGARPLLTRDMNPLCRARLDLLVARLDLEAGRPAEAIASAQSVLEVCRRLEAPWIRIEALHIVGRGRAQQHELAPAIAAFERAIDELERLRGHAAPSPEPASRRIARPDLQEEMVDVLTLAGETSAALGCVERTQPRAPAEFDVAASSNGASDEGASDLRVRHLRERLDAVHRGFPQEAIERARAPHLLHRSVP